jgi:hypothetical protein
VSAIQRISRAVGIAAPTASIFRRSAISVIARLVLELAGEKPIKTPRLTWTNKNELHDPLVRPSGNGLQPAGQALGHHRRSIMRGVSTFHLLGGALAVLVAVSGDMTIAARAGPRRR